MDDFFFDGEDEVPVFKIVLEDGKTMSFADNHKWKFLDKRQSDFKPSREIKIKR